MTPGIVPTTLDGMSLEVVDEIINTLRNGTFKFQPASACMAIGQKGKRIEIPKTNGKMRPLTIAPPRDKLVQECIRMILEAIFEPNFLENSHGFRPGKSCHTALKMIKQRFGVAS